jgi:membrane protein
VAPPERASLLASAKLAFATYRDREMMDSAAALTYYAMQSLFPALLAGVSLFGLVADPSTATRAANYILSKGADKTTADAVQQALQKIIDSQGKASVALVVSVLLALYGASGAFGAAGRALNRIYGVDEDRGLVRRKLIDLGCTLLVILLLIVVLVAVFLGGGLAADVFGTIGLGDVAASVWQVARWFVAFGAALLAYALVYAFAPDVEPRRLRWLTPGAVAGVVIWLVASALFGIYVRNFSSYGAAYGALGAAIVLLLWLFITTNAFLLGAQLNAAIERQETAGRGGPPMVSPPPAPSKPRSIPSAPRAARNPDPARESGAPGERQSG